jgi:hypothetical protein
MGGTLVDKITESMLKTFAGDNGLDALKPSLQFEHFVSYAVVQRLYGETFDTDDIVLGGDEPGIDGIAIIVNGVLVTDTDDFIAVNENAVSLDVAFVFVQADQSKSFETGKMGNFVFSVLDFFKDAPQLPQTEKVKEQAAVRAAIYNESAKFKKSNPACHLFYVTTGQWTTDPMLETRRQAGLSELKSETIFGFVEFECFGADVLQKLYRQTKNAVAREFTFAHHVPVPEIPGVVEAYLGFIPANDFLSIIGNDDGEIMRGIFESNIRDFQGYNSVNDAILQTLDSDHKARFVLMNNGVTVIARVLRRGAAYKFHIEDFQIVNGCQTSNVLFEHGGDLKDVVIPLRLISTDDEDVIQSIVTATNQQTQLSREQLFAATEFPKNLERFFQTYEMDRQIFYERRSRQYERTTVDKTRIITQANLIRAFAGMFLEEPHRTTRNFNALLDKVGTEIFKEGHKLDPYYVAAYTLYRLERLFKAQTIQPVFKAARFQILLAFRYLANPKKLPQFNSKDMEVYCKEIASVLWDTAKSDALFVKAAHIINDVTGGDMHRDKIRTVTVTDAIKTYPME